ncbi:MAG: hypothetical protein ACU0DK_14455 [Pseudooceanicola sp.]
MKFINAIAVALAAISFSPAANAVENSVLYCKVKETGRLRGLSPVFLFFFGNGDTVQIHDVYSMDEKDGPPIEASIVNRSASRVEIRWRRTVEGMRANDALATADIDHTVILFPKRNAIIVHGYPRGYDNRFTGEGTCRSQ